MFTTYNDPTYMKNFIAFTIIFCTITFDSQSNIKNFNTLDSLYRLMKNKEVYMNEKGQRIIELKKMLSTVELNSKQLYDINNKLYNEYKVYISDSAIYYAKRNQEIAEIERNNIWINESKLDLVSLYIIAGMYIESIAILELIEKQNLPDWLLVKYYNCYKQLYNFYSYNNSYTQIYAIKSQLYRDTLLSVLSKESNHYKIVYSEKLYDENKLAEAKEILNNLLKNTESDTHEKAVLAYALANIYKKEGNKEEQKKYYTISAICDIKNAIKENASMQALATILYESGDVEKAYECIKFSMEDAIFCNARLRTYEVSQIFPIIDSAYQETVERQKSELKIFLALVSLMAVFLIVAVIYVYRQMKRVAGIRKELHSTNSRLNGLNIDLQDTVNQLNCANSELSLLNTELSEANKIKEVYIGHFLDLCSTYINKLETFQNSLNKKAVEKKLDELYRILKSKDMIDNELKELYVNFDNIFLHLYPNFVQDLNSLLLEEEQFILKPTELLNVELRIFALIRLGITDSSKIAKFLHYSANTIYTYRTRVRNKSAVPREDFENLVMKIGVIKK